MSNYPGYFIKIFLLLLVSLVLNSRTESCGAEYVSKIENNSIRIKIVTFGNSITAERKTIRQVFAQRIPALLAAKDIKAEVINSGVPGSHSGRVTDNGLFKIKHALDRFETDVLDHKPDLVTIAFGTNDAYIDSKVKGGPSRIPVAQYKENLTYMIEILQARGTKIIMIIPNILTGKEVGIQNDRFLQYRKVIKKLSRKYHTGLIDNHKSFLNYVKHTGSSYDTLLLDGVHPNDKGHELIALILSLEIERIVKK